MALRQLLTGIVYSVLLLTGQVGVPGRSEAQGVVPVDSRLALTAEERAWVRANPTVRVAATPDWPPFEFVDKNGRYKGVSVEFLHLIAQRAGLKLEPVFGPWHELIEKLRQQELDVCPGLKDSAPRRQYIQFTRPFVNFPHAVVVRREDQAVTGLDALADRTVVVEQDYYTHETFKVQYPDLRLHVVSTTLEALFAVANGVADAYVGSRPVAAYLIRENMISNLHMRNLALGDIELSMGVRKDFGLLRDILQKGLESISEAERRSILEQYLTLEKRELELTDGEKAWLSAHREIRLGVDPVWPPFEFLDATKVYQGIGADYVHLMNGLLEVRMAPVPGLSWTQVIEKAKSGEVDVLPCLVKTPERSRFLSFTDPYITLSMVILARDDAPFVNGLEDFESNRIAVIRGYVTQEFLERDYPDRPFYMVDTIEEALVAVSRGDADAFVGDLASSTFATKRLGLENLRVAATTPYRRDLAFGVRKGWPELVTILNKALAVIPEEERAAIHKHWLNVRFERQVDWGLVWGVVLGISGVSGVIVSIIGVWNRRLKVEVAQRRKTEEALRLREDELVQEKERAEAASRAKSVFLGSMSHELRTPLNAILGFTQLMTRDRTVPSHHMENLETINHSGEQLLGLINTVLEMSRAEAGQAELNPIDCDLYRLLDGLEDALRVQAEEKGLQFVCDRGPSLPRYVRTDEEKLRQVLINLLDNAIKFTEEGKVILRAGFQEEGSRLNFEVEDSGPGIVPEEIERMFEAFTQPDIGYNAQEGVGLGLPISQQYVRLMDGEITVDSRVGQGTVFKFDIQIEPADSPEAGSVDEGSEQPASTDSQAASEELVTPDDLSALPADWLTELLEAAYRADSEAVMALLQQIETEHADLARGLTDLVRDFRFDTIVERVQAVEGKP